MRELTMAAGLVAPEIEERAGEVVVRFMPKGYAASSGRALTDMEQNVLQILAEQGPSRTNAIADLLSTKMSDGELEEILQTLRQLGLVEERRQGKEMRWAWSR